VVVAVFADLLGRKVLQEVPRVLSGSIFEPPPLEHEPLVFVVSMSDEVV